MDSIFERVVGYFAFTLITVVAMAGVHRLFGDVSNPLEWFCIIIIFIGMLSFTGFDLKDFINILKSIW